MMLVLNWTCIVAIFFLVLANACPFRKSVDKNADASPCPMNGDKSSNFRAQAKSPSITPTATPTFSFTPGVCQKLQGASFTPTTQGICSVYSGVKAAFPTILPNSTTQASAYSDLLGKAVRLVWHDAGEANLPNSTDKMGPDGCLSSSSDNAGLVESTSPVLTIIEPLWQQYCDKISRADFWVMFALMVVQYTAAPSPINIKYQFGRKDSHSCNAGNGRLPGAQNGLKNIYQVFVNQLGLTMSDAVTLLGAHTLGHVHIAASGYGLAARNKFNLVQNAWDATPTVFDNKYYQTMIGIPWRNVQPNGNKTNLFEGVSANLITLNQNIMLNTDMALGFEAANAETPGTHGVGYFNQTCGPKSVNGSYGCTAGSSGLGKNTTRPYTYSLVNQYTKNNQLFLDNFALSFVKLTTVGYGIAPAAAGKLGSLTSVNLTACVHIPTNTPTSTPTSPTIAPSTVVPSPVPTVATSKSPSSAPSTIPSNAPSVIPSRSPSIAPSRSPSNYPSVSPSKSPSISPSIGPSVNPSMKPTAIPSTLPSKFPTVLPSARPTVTPSLGPTKLPSIAPTFKPTSVPSAKPVKGPTSAPVKNTAVPS